MPPIDNFSVYWVNEKTADVEIFENKVKIKRYTLHPAKQIFYADEMPLFKLGEILTLRCWDEHRVNLDKYLEKLGVDGFNPFAICRKTHGVTAADRIWFKFQGEEISFEDVRWK